MIAMLIAVAALLSSVACRSEVKDTSSPENSSSIVTEEAAPTKLKNLMTETELSRVKIGELTLLDEDEPETQPESTGNVQIFIGTAEDLRERTEELKDYYDSPEEYEEQLREIDELGSDYRYIHTALVDKRVIMNYLPSLNYDGGEVDMWISQDNEFQEKVTLHNFEEVKKHIKESVDEAAEFYDDDEFFTFDAEQEYEDTIALWQSVIDGSYEVITKEEAKRLRTEYEEIQNNPAFNGDYKANWEYVRSEVEEINDSVKEISIYDEELDTEFIVHVTLPPNFDSSKTYPMFMFTDGVWRFGNVPSIRKLMENSEVQDVILVTLGYNYNFDGTSMQVRSKYFYEEREKTLDFITNNLAPYLNELYNIDFSHSGIYGHSAGGVFTHYAVFNSDKYENQPFQYYIIGSPALWQLHRLDNEKYPDAGITDYNYWDRNDTLDKTIFLCGGENEDPDYEEYYDGYDTTLEGIANLMKRLESHGVTTAKSKIYENSGHWQFIPDMFIEFFREYYGK